MNGNANREKREFVSMRINPILKDAAMEAAWRDRRSLSSLISKLLEEHCVAQGIPLEKGKSRRVRVPA